MMNLPEKSSRATRAKWQSTNAIRTLWWRNWWARHMFSIDHLGIAVKSLAQAKKFYELLGMRALGEEVVEHEKVRIAMVPVGESRIELLEATDDDSPIARFIAKRGEGLHHVAISVED